MQALRRGGACRTGTLEEGAKVGCDACWLMRPNARLLVILDGFEAGISAVTIESVDQPWAAFCAEIPRTEAAAG